MFRRLLQPAFEQGPRNNEGRFFFFSSAREMAYDTSRNPYPMNRLIVLLVLGFVPGLFAGPTKKSAKPSHPVIIFPTAGPTVPGMQARLSGRVAAAPELAPITVKRAIWAANDLRTKPYRFGGGHHSFSDNAYDCSGTVSYMLAGAGLIRAPMSSFDLRKFGESGRGRWITVYARNGHTFAIIAGLRLDTTPYKTSHDRWAPRWQSTVRFPSGFDARHPAGL